MPYAEVFKTAAEYADILRNLPVTPNAPILTTSRSGKPSSHPVAQIANSDTGYGIVQATGPFFGLDNLAKVGGVLYGRNARGAAVMRQYAPRNSEPMAVAPPNDIALALLSLIDSKYGSANS